MTHWLRGRTSPELLYLETKWGSLSPYAKVAELLKDVLPVGDALNQETVRTNLHATAERLEQELGEEQLCLFDRTQVDWEQQGLPDGPITVGIDGGYVRAAHAIFIFLLCLFTRPDRLQSLRLDQSSIMAVDLRLGTSECSSRIFLCSTISSD